MSGEFIDPYVDQTVGILRNLVGASSYDELANAEGELVTARASEFLNYLPISITGGLDDLKIIHGYLFQDVFDWAGQIRTVEIKKHGEMSQFFLPSINIETGIAWAQEQLLKDRMLKGLPKSRFVARLSYHYDNYNFVHPFREGNGRVQRLFWTLISHSAGYDLDWRLVSGEENDEASRAAAEESDLEPLNAMFSRIVVSCDPLTPLNDQLFVGRHLSE